MKRSIKYLVSLFFVVFMSVNLVGCSLTSNKDKSTIEVDNYVEKYYVNQYFLVSGTKLVVKNSKDKILEEIVVTRDMIKEMPDMTSAGEKEITILYDGKEYSYKIIVEDRPVDELVTKLNEFLAQYENQNGYTMETSYAMNLVGNYFGDEINVNDSQAMDLFSELFAADDLVNEAYHTLFNSVINGSFDLDNESITDSNNLKAKLDLIRVLEEFKNEIKDFDYKTYAFEKVFGKDDLNNIENVSSQISSMFVVKSPIGKSAIKTVVLKYYYKLKAFEFFDANEAIKELLSKVEMYTESPFIKQMFDTVDTIKNEDLIHFASSIMEDYWTNYAKVMTLEEYQKNYWNYEYTPSFVNDLNSKLLLNKFIEAQKGIIYETEDALVNLTKVKTFESFKVEVIDVLSSLEEYGERLSEITQIQKNNSWLIVVDEGYGYTEAIIGGSYLFDFYEGSVVFEPSYEETISNYNNLKSTFEYLSNYIKDYTVLDIVKEQQLVEIIVEMYFENYSQTDKEKFIDSIYGLLENDLSLKESYVDIIDILLKEENSFYVDVLSEIISGFFMVESVEGKQQINQLVDNLFTAITNAEGFDVIQLYQDLLECVSTHTINQRVKNLTTSLEELTYDELIHFASNLFSKDFESYMKIMTIDEHGKDSWIDGYQPTYVTTQEGEILLDYTITTYKELIYGVEEAIEYFASVKNVNELKNETKKLLNTLSVYTSRMKEITEIQKDNLWTIVLENDSGYSSAMLSGSYSVYCTNYECEYVFEAYYEDDIDSYDYYNFVFEKIYDYVDQYTVIEVIEENQLVELLVEKYMYDYTNEEKEKIIDLIYKILNKETNKEEIESTIEEVFITNKNATIEQLIEIFDMYTNEGFIPMINSLVSQYENEIIDALVNFANEVIDNDELVEEVQLLIEDVVGYYIDGNLNKEDLINCIKDIFNMYSSENTKATFGIATIMYHAFNYDENQDYNELFSDYLVLPNQVDNIDYNEMMRKIVNESTYDAFRISDVQVEYIVDNLDNIIGEKLSVKIDVDFDVLMVSLKGELNINIDINFTSEGN